MALQDNAASALKAALGHEVTIKSDGANYTINKPDAATQTVEATIALDTKNEALVLETSKKAAELLAGSKDLRKIAAVESPAQTQDRIKGDLKEIAATGVLPANIDEWKGVDKNIGPATIPEHALYIDHSDETGTHILIRVAKVEGQDNGAKLATLVKNLEGRKDAIMDTIIERTGKAVALSDEDKAAMKATPIKITTNESDKHSDIYIAIRNEKQSAVKEGKSTSTEAIAEAKASTAFNKLNEQQRGKVLGHAILMDKKQMVPEFVPYLGTADMRALLRRASNHYAKTAKEQSPEILQKLADIQQEDLLHDRHQWNRTAAQRDVNKVTPYIGVDNHEPGFLKIKIAVPYGKRDEALTALSKIQAVASKDTMPATAKPAEEGAAIVAPIAKAAEEKSLTPEVIAAPAEKPPVTVGNTVIEPQKPVAITPELAKSFLDKVQREAGAGAGVAQAI